MTLTKTLRVLSATALTGGLLFTGIPAASADQVRDGQWANQYFDLNKVWSVSKGDGVIVAVIDGGVDASHADLTGQVLPGYDPSGNGVDQHPGTDPHGTGMASLIAGHGHGADAGVLGLAPGAKILPIYKGTAEHSDAVPQDIRWAVDHGAKVINISLGGNRNSSYDDAIAYAVQHDVLVVAASGNEGSAVSGPAAVPGALAVGATDKVNQIWQKSNAGPEVLLSAPGVEIVNAGACDGKQYCLATGTSPATAYVSAAAALVRAKFPKLTAGQVANRLVKSALVPSSLKGAQLPDEHYGYGIIRPYEALTQNIPAGSAQGPLAKPASSADSGSGTQTSGATGGATNPDPGALPPIADSGSSGSTVFYVAGVGVVFVVLLIAVIVVVSRRRRAPAPGAAGPAAYGTPPGWPQGQQPYPGQAQPPYPNQPQSPYGNQAPPQGYPPQQPYQNPYGPGGNQQR